MTTDNFYVAVNEIFKDEGGKTKDHAGLTNFGITLNALMALNIDLNGDGVINVQDIADMTKENAFRFFRAWWDREKYSRIFNEKVACKIMNISVNTGAHQAHIITQRSCRSCGIKLIEDGVMGSQTMDAINKINPDMLLTALKSETAGFYRTLVAQNPAKYEKYLEGWLENRAYD